MTFRLWRSFLRSSLASILSSSFLGTAIKPFSKVSNRSKDRGGSSQFLGTLMRFFIYTFFRFPRFWRGSLRPRQSLVTGLRPLAGQFVISKAFASKSSRRFHEPISISSFASVESETLFVEVAEQVKRFYANVSTFDHPF